MISILLALDIALGNGKRHMAVELLADYVDRDMDSLHDLLEMMSEAGYIEIKSATELVPYPTVSLKKELGEISIFEIMSLKKEPTTNKFIKSILQDISLLDMKEAKKELESGPETDESAELMFLDLQRRIAERESRRKNVTVLN